MPTRTEAKMLSHVPENTRRRIGNAILVALALGLLAALWGTVLRVRESMDEGRREVREAVGDARHSLMSLCNVNPASIGEHSSDDPDPVLMASIANDQTKDVLIFKQSAGTGFDAPRAFVLASTATAATGTLI